MKHCVLALCLFVFTGSYSQQFTPVFDTITNNIQSKENFKGSSIANNVLSIVNITAGGELGQGLLVGKDLVITSLSLVAGKYDVSYVYGESDEPLRFDGYVAVDPERGIVLLKTKEYHSTHSAPGHSFARMLESWRTDLHIVHKNGSRYIVDRAKLVKKEGTSSFNTPRRGKNEALPVVYNGSKPINGYQVYESSITAGMIVYRNGEPYHVNNNTLSELMVYKDLAVNSLSDLYSYAATGKKGKSKAALYKIGLTYENRGTKSLWDVLRLDYVKRDKQQLIFYFSFSSKDWSAGTSFTPKLDIVDLKTGHVYHSTNPVTTPNYVYSQTTYRCAIVFDNVPEEVNHVKIFDMPEDVYDYHQSIFFKTTPKNRKFFDDVFINNYPTTNKPEYDLDLKPEQEGTVAFYGLESSNLSGDVKISIDGRVVGYVSEYYTSKTMTDFCGKSATVTVRLKAGEYKFKATMGRNTMERKIYVQAGKCINQLIKF